MKFYNDESYIKKLEEGQTMINDQPLVSVGIPTYNRPEGLRRT